MPLPAGFNPNNMSFAGVSTRPVINIPRNNSGYSSTTYRPSHRSWWSRFNDGVADIGNWFSDHADSAMSIACVVVTVLLILGGIISVISAWVSNGFWAAVFTAIAALIIVSILLYVASIVIAIVANIIMYAFRILFWNGWTLMAALLIAGSLCVSNFLPSYGHASADTTEDVQLAVPDTETYRCTAQVLNVRSQPNTNSSVLGGLTKGQTVEVYDTSNGFARISYGGREGYVSLKYMTKVEE